MNNKNNQNNIDKFTTFQILDEMEKRVDAMEKERRDTIKYAVYSVILGCCIIVLSGIMKK